MLTGIDYLYYGRTRASEFYNYASDTKPNGIHSTGVEPGCLVCFDLSAEEFVGRVLVDIGEMSSPAFDARN